MASTVTSDSVVYERVERVERVHKYRWPGAQLNFWLLIMLIASCTIIGVFATFVQIQQELLLPIPWYFPYFITVAALGVLFVCLMLYLIYNRRLLPSIVMIGGFMLFVLWMVGLVAVSVELWGPAGAVSNNCQMAVFSQSATGQYLSTLAWMEERSICQCWDAVFSFALVGVIFLLWIMVMAYQVFTNDT